MTLFDRIANYFKEWDGVDETAPKMELDIHELRYIANMNVERGRLIRQLNEVNLKTEALLLDKTQEIRAKTIDEMVGGIREILECNAIYNIDCITTLAEQLKAGAENE